MFNFNDLTNKIAALETFANGDETTLHEGFGNLSLNYDDFPVDVLRPNSQAYRAQQFDIYEAISGRQYGLTNEEVKIDVDTAVKFPFPYNTLNRAIIANHHAILGFAFEHFDVPAGSRVFEMGVGWGNLAIALSKTGYRVAGCDLENRFVDLLKRRAEHEGVSIEIRHEDFLSSSCFSEHYDAIIFNACFHHCHDHHKLLDKLAFSTDDKIRIFFIGESIYQSYPWPWGVNLYGQAVFCIRKFGWLELAFNEDYFLTELYRRGLAVRRSEASFSEMTTIFACKKIAAFLGRELPFSNLQLIGSQERTFPSRGRDAKEIGRWSGGRSVFSIPDQRLRSFSLCLDNHKPVPTSVVVETDGRATAFVVKPGETREVEIESYNGTDVTVWSECHRPSAEKWNNDARLLGIYCRSLRINNYIK